MGLNGFPVHGFPDPIGIQLVLFRMFQIIELDDGKNFTGKTYILMVKNHGFLVDFPLKPIH